MNFVRRRMAVLSGRIQTACDVIRMLPSIRKLGLPLRFVWRAHRQGAKLCQISFLGRVVRLNHPFWFLHGVKELFLDHSYLFYSDSPSPRIIDCGANIGLSAIYFKQCHPQARITAFESDPGICALLNANLRAFTYNDIEVRNEAVWIEAGRISFITSGGVGGRIGHDGEDNAVVVPAVRLRDFLNEPVDFLKIDIEGAEGAVLRDCAGHLGNVANIFIEYHSSEELPQDLDDILRILKEAGFRYYIKEAWINQPRPYTNKRTNLFDLQLNIFGYRLPGREDS